MTTSPKRTFIGWTKPILQAATERLFDEHAQAGVWDLRRWLIVLPSSMAKRRLQELLAVRADEAQCVLYPPQIETVGQLPEHLYVAKNPFASDMVQILAWCQALERVDARQLEKVLPLPPRHQYPEQWLELGKMLSGVHRELASDRLDFAGVVQELGSHPEAARWAALSKVQVEYWNVLDSLKLWDVQTARLKALEYNEASTTQRVLMLATVDLNEAQRGFVSAIADQVEVWVAAPAEMADRFDELGCLIGQAWEEACLDLPPETLLVGNSPNDQFELTSASLAELGDEWHARDITLGVPDSSLVPLLQQHLNVSGAEVRFGAGTPLAQSEPARLLALVGNYLQNRSAMDFAALVRHPVLRRLVAHNQPELGDNWLADIDRYTTEVLPRKVEAWINDKAKGAAAYGKIVELVDQWIAPLNVLQLRIDQWSAPLLELLRTAYADQSCSNQNPEEERLSWACRGLATAIVTLRDIPEDLTLSLSPAEAIDWVMQSLSGQLVPQPTSTAAIEMLGWLDLTLDDAPALIITGMHDGVVPEAVNADPFLPNQLRRQLGMIDNSRRYARDMYAFQVMLHSRRHLRVIVGRNNLNGDPLVPSRLLLACELAELPARVLRLTDDDTLDVLPEVQSRWQQRGQSSAPAYTTPPPDSSRIPPHISVTAFRTYMACPYRFYLKHVCHLKTVDDLDAELDAGQFGDLIHNTLDRFHESPLKNSSDPAAIEIYLRETVEELALEKYGPNQAAAIRVQVAGAQDRLAAFAVKQAEHIRAGWVTRYNEVEAVLDIGEDFAGHKLPIKLLGRIDRIDYHPETKQWAIWDYKTSDSGTKPVPNHVNARTGWSDLQLPLYRHVVRALGIPAEPTVGYILLPKSLKDIEFVPANFSATQLQEADDEAWRVISSVAAGKYEPVTSASVPFDDFERICLIGTQSSVPPRPARRTSDHRRASSSLRLAAASVVEQARQRLGDEEYIARRGSVAPVLYPLMIRASAGTGKTYQLSNRLLQIILSGQNVDHILATTFTRKAAGEILQRVLVRLAKSCIDAKAFNDLQTAIDQLPIDQADCLAALRRVTRQLHRFRVSTLDSFYAQIARTFSLELRLAPGWSAIDPVREAAVRMQAIQRMLDQSDQRTLNSLVKMLAKGDTKRSVAAEIEDTVQGAYHYYRAADHAAFNNLTVPTGPAQTELLEAIEFLQRYDPQHKSIKNAQDTVASLAIIGDWEGVIGHGLMKAAVETGKYYSRELSPKLLDRLALLRRQCAAELLPLRRAQTSAAYDLLDSFDEQYMSLLRRQRMLAFADITYLLSRWMNPNATARISSDSSNVDSSDRKDRSAAQLPMIEIDQQQLQLRMDCGIHHLLLDEFQDTAPDQWRILEPLAVPLTETITAQQSFFCVGDTKQAIYGWRGGVAEIFDTVASSVHELTEKSLSESYRSSPDVMQVVNDVFLELPRHENFADCNEVAVQWSNHFPSHKTKHVNLPGYVLVKNGIVVEQEIPKEERDLVEMEYSAQMIADLAAASRGQSIGVLFRENRKVAMMIELLRKRGVSASQEGGNPLTDSAAVQLILSLVHLADHPGDTVAAYHIQTSPLIQQLPKAASQRIGSLAAWVWQQVTTLGLGRAISNMCDLIAPSLSWWEQHRLKQLITLAYQFETQFTHRLRDFERFVQDQKVALPSEAQVKVMTIHSSKGLEFDAVFLPDLGIPLSGHPPLMVTRSPDPVAPPTGVLRYMNDQVQTLLPAEWRQAFHDRKAHSVREILCVLYVAMTRARCALYMITAPRSSKFQNDTQKCESVLQSVLSTKELYKTPETVLYEHGNPQWYLPTESSESVVTPAIETAIETQFAPALAGLLTTAGSLTTAGQLTTADSAGPIGNVIGLKTSAESAPRRGYRVAAPSSMSSRANVALDQLFTVSQTLGAALGTLVHACFEQVEWLDGTNKKLPKKDVLREAIVNALTPDELRHVDIDKEIDGFQRMLQFDSVQGALSRSRYDRTVAGLKIDEVCVENERRISLIMDNQLIDGTIDRLVVMKHQGQIVAAEILDYKTDRLDRTMNIEEWTRERIEHHKTQLRAYAQVVSRMLKIPTERIECSLILLSADRCVRCDDFAPPAPHLKYKQLTLAW